ncbi:hypothetical protein PMZ80_003026 [Knufia obscura]|uniref:Heterokaryon incompatibility domain-containing protein n=2 Tax=Knufia TaxID=430999 RepID=A0AAN8I6W4_9EURO|nr:hypothetical protein PMZ80_003026 [Knufia obscura]KAK5952386.1 hypothetical protein OHC33_006429 [Knufia fluminis]
MRLINTRTYQLEEFHDEHQVKYAILSHRREDQEVLFKDMATGVDQDHIRNKTGWYKIQKTCEHAEKDGLHYAWVDTCCIDKSSSAELQEAINSMFRWYAKAEVCYAYLSDVSRPVRWFPKIFGLASRMAQDLVNSQWFKRGWTLQELLAPTQVIFFDAD